MTMVPGQKSTIALISEINIVCNFCDENKDVLNSVFVSVCITHTIHSFIHSYSAYVIICNQFSWVDRCDTMRIGFITRCYNRHIVIMANEW